MGFGSLALSVLLNNDITVLNQQGQNLLAPPAVFTKENIDLLHVVNGQAKPYNANSNKGFFLYQTTIYIG
jgi:hypothetical protein